MSNNVSHFDIQADDLKRARRFYENVFGWQFRAWGPPDFFLITTGTKEKPGIHGALSKRREAVTGKGMIGYQCTISVESVDKTAKAVKANGGTITLPRTAIEGVGKLVEFQDTEGNLACAMQYEPGME